MSQQVFFQGLQKYPAWLAGPKNYPLSCDTGGFVKRAVRNNGRLKWRNARKFSPSSFLYYPALISSILS